MRVLLASSWLLLVAGVITSQAAEPRSFSINTLDHEEAHLPPDEGYPEEEEYDLEVRRYECPAGFFRLRKFCYYLSAGTAQWKEAHFACTARNASLAILDRPQKDKLLRKYLSGDQFRQLERWIGGLYNWRQKNWDWGVSGEKVKYKNFGHTETPPVGFSMSCIVLDPIQEYMWSTRSCLEQKYFICEVPAGRVGKSRRRKNISNDPLAPQNQRLRPSRKEQHKLERERRRKKSMRKKNWHPRNEYQVWAHGVKPGSRPPKGFYSNRMRLNKGTRRPRHGRRNKSTSKPEPRVEEVTSPPAEYRALTAVGSAAAYPFGNGLSDETNHQSQLIPRFGDIAHEEILLKLHLP